MPQYQITLTKPGEKAQIGTMESSDKQALAEQLNEYLKSIGLFRKAKFRIELVKSGPEKEISREKLHTDFLGLKDREVSKYAEMQINQERNEEIREKREKESNEKNWGGFENLFEEK